MKNKDLHNKLKSIIDEEVDNVLAERKYKYGGILDIEFFVQTLCLINAEMIPSLLSYTDNIRQLSALCQHHVIDTNSFESLFQILLYNAIETTYYI